MAIEQFQSKEKGVDHRGKLNQLVDAANAAGLTGGTIPHDNDVVLGGIQHDVDLLTTGDYNASITDTVNAQAFGYTFGPDVATESNSKTIEIDNSGNSVSCVFTFVGTWVWGSNIEPTGIAAGAKGMLVVTSRKTEVFASYVPL